MNFSVVSTRLCLGFKQLQSEGLGWLTEAMMCLHAALRVQCLLTQKAVGGCCLSVTFDTVF